MLCLCDVRRTFVYNHSGAYEWANTVEFVYAGPKVWTESVHGPGRRGRSESTGQGVWTESLHGSRGGRSPSTRPGGVDGVRPRVLSVHGSGGRGRSPSTGQGAWTESVQGADGVRHGSGGGGAWTEWTDLTPLPHQISLPHHTHTIIIAIHVCVLFSVVCLLVYDDKIVTMYYLSLICNNKLC